MNKGKSYDNNVSMFIPIKSIGTVNKHVELEIKFDAFSRKTDFPY